MLKNVFMTSLLFLMLSSSCAQSNFMVPPHNNNFVIAFRKNLESEYEPVGIIDISLVNESEKLNLIRQLLKFKGGDSTNRKEPIPFNELREELIKDLIKGSFYKRKSCERDYKAFEESLFLDWIREKHYKAFLKNKD